MSRPPRLIAFEYRGKFSYFITFCTFERHDTLREATIAQMALDQFRRTAQHFGFAILAYCLMPDHVHLLVHGERPDADLRRFIGSAKRRSGEIHARRYGQPLWQEGYYDHVIRPEESLFQIGRYIIENPVRAGLVNRVEDYRFCGSDAWTLADLLKIN